MKLAPFSNLFGFTFFLIFVCFQLIAILYWVSCFSDKIKNSHETLTYNWKKQLFDNERHFFFLFRYQHVNIVFVNVLLLLVLNVLNNYSEMQKKNALFLFVSILANFALVHVSLYEEGNTFLRDDMSPKGFGCNRRPAPMYLEKMKPACMEKYRDGAEKACGGEQDREGGRE